MPSTLIIDTGSGLTSSKSEAVDVYFFGIIRLMPTTVRTIPSITETAILQRARKMNRIVRMS